MATDTDRLLTRIEEMLAVESRATRGPWLAVESRGIDTIWYDVVAGDQDVLSAECGMTGNFSVDHKESPNPISIADTQFVAAIRNSARPLLDLVRALVAERDAMDKLATTKFTGGGWPADLAGEHITKRKSADAAIRAFLEEK